MIAKRTPEPQDTLQVYGSSKRRRTNAWGLLKTDAFDLGSRNAIDEDIAPLGWCSPRTILRTRRPSISNPMQTRIGLSSFGSLMAYAQPKGSISGHRRTRRLSSSSESSSIPLSLFFLFMG